MSISKYLFFIAFISLGGLAACGGESVDSSETAGETVQSKPASEDLAAETTQAAPMPVVNRGESLFKRCKTCHTLNDGGAHKTGPNLFNIFGATAGTKEGFRYSKVMRESGVIWTDENLMEYIRNPREFMPRNTMSFAGIRKDEDLVALLDFMRAEIGQ